MPEVETSAALTVGVGLRRDTAGDSTATPRSPQGTAALAARFTFHATRSMNPSVAKYEDLRGDENSLLATTGLAWVFGDHIARQQLIADDHIDQHPSVAKAFVLATVDPQFARRITAGDFLVAGLDFAADVTGRSIAAALKALGIAAVIARSFGQTFARDAINMGLPALVVEETAAIKQGDHLRVDIEAHIVANLSSGDRYVIRNLDDAALATLRSKQGFGDQ